jgi:beta-galactosidase/beta-glucuronidase
MRNLVAVVLSLLASLVTTAQADWKPAEGRLMTRWAKEVSPEKAWPEYPRPQLVRPDWHNLNGLWQYAVRPKDAAKPEQWDGEILVPFCIESALSGVMKRVGPDERLWYRRTFSLPEGWPGRRVLLHFGGVDWEAKVLVNGKDAGEHRGGYDPFTFEITELLKEGENEVVVRVWDPTNRGYQPRGKQVLEPKGIWYTPVTGIWQTVWLEPVPTEYIRRLRIVPDFDASAVHVTVDASDEGAVRVEAADGDQTAGQAEGRTGSPVTVRLNQPKPWSPDAPHLYDLKVTLVEDGKTVDEVGSYFGLRKIEVGKDRQGFNRLLLNGKPLFQYGPLDQGWWPDGLYTAATDEALRYDVEVTKALGFNMTRKHVKVEPARWYYWCDKLGLLVWQDMPSGDAHPKWIRDVDVEGPELRRSAESKGDFLIELTEMVEDFYNHPSIIVWVPFNESWGQFDTAAVVAWLRRLDPTRLVNSASGGNFLGVGDILDVHSYPDPAMSRLDPYMAAVCGEFGGLGLPVEGHTWLDKGNWGYRSFDNPEALTKAYLEKIAMLHPLIQRGLAAAVYTQITDVEIEVNGHLTYDRAVIKMDQKAVAEANRRLYGSMGENAKQ